MESSGSFSCLGKGQRLPLQTFHFFQFFIFIHSSLICLKVIQIEWWNKEVFISGYRETPKAIKQWTGEAVTGLWGMSKDFAHPCCMVTYFKECRWILIIITLILYRQKTRKFNAFLPKKWDYIPDANDILRKQLIGYRSEPHRRSQSLGDGQV